MMERVLRPAAAYHVMAELLPASYFVCRPPAAGVRLRVEGADGVPTWWDMGTAQASDVAVELSCRRLRVTSTTYVDPPGR